MSARKSKGKKITEFHQYETTQENGGYVDRYTRMTHDQLVSMNNLNHSSFRLYIMMKDYAAGKIETEYPYRIYKNWLSKGGFQTAIAQLVDEGYIEPFTSSKNLRKANKYRFSTKWRDNTS